MIEHEATQTSTKRVERRAPGDAVAELRQRNEEFGNFFRAEYSRVVKTVMYSGAAFEEAEDAVAWAMREAYDCWSTLARPASWVRTVALHKYLKTAARDRLRGNLETKAAHRNCLDRIPVQTVEEPDELSQITTVLRKLPPAQRVVMALTIDGYSPMEISQMIHWHPDTVRSNLRHARIKLRNELET